MPEEQTEDPRRKAVESAYTLLKKDPHFARVQVNVMDAIEAVNERLGGSIPVKAAERLEYALKLLDARAEAFLSLVVNIESQEAYAILLREFTQITWCDYVGVPAGGAFPPPGNSAASQIEMRMRHWVKESYRRLIPDTKASGETGQYSVISADDAQPSATDPPDVLIEKRDRLLKGYKAATGHPSNRQIYTAVNSGIHKPEFYDWTNGVLSSDSATCQNFERFLKERKPPIPRKRK